MHYVWNSAVISRPGHYEYKLITEIEAEVWLRQSRFVSRVGSREVAQLIQDRFGVHCPLSLEPIVMQPGDEALVLRLIVLSARSGCQSASPSVRRLGNWLAEAARRDARGVNAMSLAEWCRKRFPRAALGSGYCLITDTHQTQKIGRPKPQASNVIPSACWVCKSAFLQPRLAAP